jgi:hypothetical protein
MANYSMTCSCGYQMSLEAPNRNAAVSQLQSMMDARGIEQHFAEHHKPDEQRPTVEQVHGMIEQLVTTA